MRTLLAALACTLLVACGGDDGDSPVVISKLDTSKTTLKVVIPGYEGDAVVEVNGDPHPISGASVHKLGVFPEGTAAMISLMEWEDGYNCWPTWQQPVLTDISFTVLFHCNRDDSLARPLITYVSNPSSVAIDRSTALHVNAYSPSGNPILGFTLDAVSSPSGATFTHETQDSPFVTQFFRMDTPGNYVIEVRAVTIDGLSEAVAIEIQAYDPPPQVTFSLSPADAYTDTDITAISTFTDNAPASVTLSHAWYINDVLVPNTDGATLSSGLFKKGDSVQVEIIATDSFNQVTTSRKGLTILDSPAEVDASNIPVQINRGTPLSVDLIISDKDIDDLPSVSLAYGPKGMEISNNRLQWHADPILISDEGTFNFGISLSADTAALEELTIKVVDDRRQSIAITRAGTAHSQLGMPGRLLDYDNDGEMEAINRYDQYITITNVPTGNVEWALNTLGYNRKGAMRSVVFVPRDGNTALVAVLSDYVIDLIDPITGKSLASRQLDTLGTSAYNTGMVINYVRGATPGDGYIAISINSGRQLAALDAATLEPSWQTISGTISEAVLIANLDTDPQDEIVTSTGYVFDGENGTNQWIFESVAKYYELYQADLGYSLAAYRLQQGVIRLVDFHNKSYADIPSGITYIRTIGTGNLDADDDDELVVDGSANTVVFDYDRNTQTFIEAGAYTIDYKQEQRVVRKFTDDGKAALVGINNSSITFHDIVSDTSWHETAPLCSGESRNYLPTIADTNPASISVAIHCTNSENAYVPFLVSLDPTSKEITYTQVAGQSASVFLTGFIDNDPNPDAVAGNENTIAVRDLDTGVDTWSTASPGGKNGLLAMDINGDGVMEVLARNSYTVDIHDIVSQSIIGQTVPATEQFFRGVRDAEVFKQSSTGTKYLAVMKGDALEVYEIDENGAALIARKPVDTPSDIALIDYDSDQTMEIALLHQTYSNDFVDILDPGLNIVTRVTMPERFSRLATYPDSSTHVLGVRNTSTSIELVEIDLRAGEVTWEGPTVSAKLYHVGYSNYVEANQSVAGVHLRISAGYSSVIAW